MNGACYYTDTVTDDARLVLRVLQESIALGGSAINYAQVTKLLLEQGQVRGVSVRDPESGQQLLLRAPVVAGTQYCLAECRWAARYEGVIHLDDLMLRRTRLGLLLPEGGAQLFDCVRRICFEELNWDDADWSAELARYQQILARFYSVPEPEAAAANE